MKKRNAILFCLVAVIITFSINVYAESCGEVFNTGDGSLISILNKDLYVPIKWITPLLLLVLTSFDFAKVVFSGDGKGMDKAKNNFLKRSIAALIIFFAPDIINLLVDFVNKESIAACLDQIK